MHDLASLLPMAVGLLISPLPIVAVVAILLSPRGRAAGPLYALGFTAVTLVFVAIGAVTAAGASSSDPHGGHIVGLVLTIALTAGFAALAISSWVTRPRAGAAAKTPGWLAAVDSITPARAIGLGLLMAVTNSKNIPLELKAGVTIANAHLDVVLAIILCVAFAIVGSLTLIVPTLLAATGSAAVARGLDRLKGEMIEHNAVILTVLFALLAANEGAHLIHLIAS